MSPLAVISLVTNKSWDAVKFTAVNEPALRLKLPAETSPVTATSPATFKPSEQVT